MLRNSTSIVEKNTIFQLADSFEQRYALISTQGWGIAWKLKNI